jgi:hypothetical protein
MSLDDLRDALIESAESVPVASVAPAEVLARARRRLRRRRSARGLVGAVAIVVAITAVVAAIAGRTASSRTPIVVMQPSPATIPISTPEIAIRAAASDWAKAFIAGTFNDFKRLQGSDCNTSTRESTVDARAGAAQLAQLRRDLRQRLGVPLDQVKILGVSVRRVTARTAEAEVIYNLPASVVGSDNWVTYEFDYGLWKVDCRAGSPAPIARKGDSVSTSVGGLAPLIGWTNNARAVTRS